MTDFKALDREIRTLHGRIKVLEVRGLSDGEIEAISRGMDKILKAFNDLEDAVSFTVNIVEKLRGR